MSNKKRNRKNNNLPFSNEVKLMKDDFKKTIDEMSDDEFLSMLSLLMFLELLNILITKLFALDGENYC